LNYAGYYLFIFILLFFRLHLYEENIGRAGPTPSTKIAKASVSPVNAVWKAVEKLYGKPVNAALLFRANKVCLGSMVGKEKRVVGNSKVKAR